MEQEEKNENIMANENDNFDLFGQSFNEIQTDSLQNNDYVVNPSMESIADSISNIEINSNATIMPDFNNESTGLDNNLGQMDIDYSFEPSVNMENDAVEIMPTFNQQTPVDNITSFQSTNYEFEPQLNNENNLFDNNVNNMEFNIYNNIASQNQNEYKQSEPLTEDYVQNNDVHIPIEEDNIVNQNTKINNEDMASDEEIKKFFKDFVIIAIIVIIVIIALPYVNDLIGF